MRRFIIFNLLAFLTALAVSEIPAVKQRYDVQQRLESVILDFQNIMDQAAASRDMSPEAIGTPQKFDEQSILEIQNTLNRTRTELKHSADRESLIDTLSEKVREMQEAKKEQ